MKRPSNPGARQFAISLIVGLLLLALAARVSGQQIEMSSSLNPVGSGARATGMGGAFIGVADDATAASWNPAGLVQLEKPEISVVYSYFHREQGYGSSVHPEIAGDNKMDANGINYVSAAYPFVLLKRNMVVSLNYQRLYEMDKKVSFKYDWDIGGDKLHDNINFKQEGYLYALSPAMAIQVTPEFYLGATLNFWGDYLGENGWQNTYRSSASGRLAGNAVTETVDWKNELSFRGINAHLGFLWNVYGPFTIGAVLKTPFDAKLRKETTFFQTQDFPAVPQHTESFSATSEELTMKMPASYGIGFAYRHGDKLTVAFDVYRTDWSGSFIKDPKGKEINPLDGAPLDRGRLKDTTQLRLGAEYLFIGDKRAIPVRAGVFYDPEPAKGRLDDFYGFSLGTGYSTDKISLDAAYQYRFGRHVSGDIPYIKGSSVDMDQHTLILSVIYYF